MATSKDSGKAEAPKADASPDVEKAEAEVQQAVDKETEQGFRGNEADPTDNHAYTVDGVTSGEATPETDEKQAAKVNSGRFRA